MPTSYTNSNGAVYTYHYAKQWKLKWSTVISTAFVDSYDEGTEVAVTGVQDPAWVIINRQSLWDKKRAYKVQKGHQLLLSVRFYCKKVHNGVTTYYLLNKDVISNLKVNWGSDAEKLGKTTGPIDFDDELTSNQVLYAAPPSPPAAQVQPQQVISNQSYITTANRKSAFWANFSIKNAGFSMDNPGVVTATINLGSLYANFGGDELAGTKNFTQIGETVLFTVYDNVKTPPEVPPSFVAATATLVPSTSTSTGEVFYNVKYFYSRCEQLWYAINIRQARADNNKTSIFQISTCETNGDKRNNKVLRYEEKVIKGPLGPKALKELQVLRKKQIGNCKAAGSSGNGNGNGSSNPPAPDSRLLPTGNLRWNPPPHNSSRSTAFMEYATQLDSNLAELIEPAFAKLTTAELRKGRLFQDSLGAEILNTNPDKLALPGKGKQQWGFRFMYNPTTFSYSSASNNNVDWTMGASDPTALIAGNSTVQFELYINRIIDMSFLKQRDAKKQNATVNTTTLAGIQAASGSSTLNAYSRQLQTVEIEGILNRGTEYDIEFLYRVLNGDPLKDPLLFSKEYAATSGGVTSDFGYTTAIPCWLYLNENLRYYGSVANFNVNHVMFDLNMVPMLSVVSITFNRYPALFNAINPEVSKADKKALDAFSKRGNSVKSFITATDTDPAETDEVKK